MPSIEGWIFNIQRMSVHDGPGIRSTVFLKGCPLDCAWCHNPESKSPKPQLGYSPALCVGCMKCVEICSRGAHKMNNGVHEFNRERCDGRLSCVDVCYSNALEAIGSKATAKEVMREVLKDKVFYDESGGGMTVSGGEPFFQYPFMRALLEAAKKEGIHTCVETSGYAPREDILGAAQITDLFLFDIKETNPELHELFTGVSNSLILENLHTIDNAGAKTILRCPIIPNANLRSEHIEAIAKIRKSLVNCQGVHLIGYHPLGESKRCKIGSNRQDDCSNIFPEVTHDMLQDVAKQLFELGLNDVEIL